MGSGGTMAWEPRSGGLKDRTAKDTFKKKAYCVWWPTVSPWRVKTGRVVPIENSNCTLKGS